MKSSTRIVILTGAGVSAASGLPTYRGAGGLWDETNVAEHATAAAIAADPRKVWTFYARLRREVGSAAFNPGHHALARALSAARYFFIAAAALFGLSAGLR